MFNVDSSISQGHKEVTGRKWFIPSSHHPKKGASSQHPSLATVQQLTARCLELLAVKNNKGSLQEREARRWNCSFMACKDPLLKWGLVVGFKVFDVPCYALRHHGDFETLFEGLCEV